MNAALVSESSLFALLDQSEREGLAKHLVKRELADGQVVFHADEAASSLYLVCSGRVEVVLEAYDGERVVLDVLLPGEVLGEISFFDGGPRTASAYAVGDTELLECTHDTLLNFLIEHPHAALDVMAMMGKRLRRTDELLRRRVVRNANEEEAEQLTLGDRVADRVATFGGSWRFIIVFVGVLVAWVVLNTLLLVRHPFDPYPYILLNLLLSMIAALQAPVIMMSQNRQTAKDRLKADLDYAVNLKAELEITELRQRVEAIYDLLKSDHGTPAASTVGAQLQHHPGRAGHDS